MTQIKLLIYGGILLALAIVVGTIYGCGRKDANDKTDLRVARETIKVERETLKITSETHMRVDLEGVQTAQTAEAATREIERIRTAPARTVVPAQSTDPGDLGRPVLDDPVATARVLQLAREARAATIESAARLRAADKRR